MHAELVTLIERLDHIRVSETNVIKWGCPVPSFGDLSIATVATLGLNPSNREFMDENGNELSGPLRRLHTLSSLGLSTWSEVDASHLEKILDSCRTYFFKNPYDAWFRKLDMLIDGANTSFYSDHCHACHLDLIPYATNCKWTQLTPKQRTMLLEIADDTLGLLLRDSPVKLLVLNGRSVVEMFQHIAGVMLKRQFIPSWSLPRRAGSDVKGTAFWGTAEVIAGVALERQITVLGFNHNIQSSFGVTEDVVRGIRDWIAVMYHEVTH